jgi:hypothetical protein
MFQGLIAVCALISLSSHLVRGTGDNGSQPDQALVAGLVYATDEPISRKPESFFILCTCMFEHKQVVHVARPSDRPWYGDAPTQPRVDQQALRDQNISYLRGTWVRKAKG